MLFVWGDKMRTIPIKQAKAIIKQLLKAKTDQEVTLLTRKKDRSLTIAVQAGQFTLTEQGYVNASQSFKSDDSTIRHEVAAAFKREFPRSHQLYINQTKNQLQLNFYNPGCKPFFKKHSSQKKVIVDNIAKAINKELATGMTKVKLASRQKIAGDSVYEFRLNLGKIGSARIAFTVQDKQANVYFITSDLQKSAFSREFDRILAGMQS